VKDRSSQHASYLGVNRDLWDFWTELHTTISEEYLEATAQVRAGGITLDDIVLSEVGDVAGRSLLHLQCHLGLDTLSWARMGAKATGVDFAEKSVTAAQCLSRELGLAATFVCADIYDLPTVLDQQYDIVFTSDGVWPWLPDLDGWAEVVAGYRRGPTQQEPLWKSAMWRSRSRCGLRSGGRTLCRTTTRFTLRTTGSTV